MAARSRLEVLGGKKGLVNPSLRYLKSQWFSVLQGRFVRSECLCRPERNKEIALLPSRSLDTCGSCDEKSKRPRRGANVSCPRAQKEQS